jgi:hypothetical protein
VPGTGEPDREAAHRRADAVGLLAERALAFGFGGAGRGGCGGGKDGVADGAAQDPAPPPPLSGTRAERYQVLLHVEPATLSAEGDGGRSDLEDGTRVSREASRRLCCDASVVRVTESPDGGILSVGRKTRTIPPALRRALEIRDRGCRFPGCGLRFTDAHHVTHWATAGRRR